MQNPPPVQTEQAKSSTGLDENIAALLSYVFGWISGLIFFLIEKDSRLVRFHAMQSLLFNILVGVAVFVLWIVLFVFFFVNGASILRRSRWGYLFLAAFAALPLLGSLAYSFHLLTLFASGQWRHDSRGVFSGLFGITLAVLIVFLFRNLLSRTVLSYVWGEGRRTVPNVQEP